MTADTIQLLSKSNRDSACQYGCIAWYARLLPSFCRMDSMLSWRWYTTAAEEFPCRKSSTVPHSHGVHYIL